LLGTTALIAASPPSGVRADVTITANTTNTVVPDVPGANITVTNSGSITGTSVGVQMLGANTAGTVSNEGLIDVTITGIQTASSGSVSGGIRNSGTLTGIGGLVGISVNSSSQVGNGISNSGTITQFSVGISINNSSSVSGGIQNSGIIDQTTTGISVFNDALVEEGIENTGTLSNTFVGVDIVRANLTGGIRSGTQAQDGNIFALMDGISISRSALSGGIENHGLISAAAGSGIEVGLLSTVSGGVSNFGTIEIGNPATIGIGIGQFVEFDGDILNSGQITGAGTGIRVGFRSTVDGAITNRGGITSSDSPGILITRTSSVRQGIVNEAGGTIRTASESGIEVNQDAVVRRGIWNDGLIEHTGGRGITLDKGSVLGGIENNGEILGGDSGIGIVANSTVQGSIVNNGTIQSQAVGIIVDDAIVLEAIVNDGLIQSETYGISASTFSSLRRGIVNEINGVINAPQGIVVSSNLSLRGGIRNTGTIESTFGIVIENSARMNGRLINQGRITGDGGAAIFVTGASDLFGEIVNTGTLSGDVGVRIETDSFLLGGITNSGIIIGTGGIAVQLGDEDDVVTLQTGSSIVGMTDASDGNDILNLEGMGTEDDVFLNFEQLNMNGSDWTLSGDIELLTGSPNSGDVNVNSGVLAINGTLTAPGGVNLSGGSLGGTGDVVASITVGSGGTISPGNSIGVLNITGDVALGSGSFFEVEVEGSTADLLNVTGDVTIDPSSTVNVIPLDGGIDVVDQVIIDAGGTIDANFQNIEPGGLIATTELRGTSQIILNAVSPVATEIGSSAGSRDSFAFQEALTGPLGDTGAVMVGPGTQLWAKGIYEFNERDNSTDFTGFDQETSGIVIGLDQSLAPSFRLGGAFGFTDSDVVINMRTGDADVQSFYGALYGLLENNAFRLNVGAQMGRQDKDLTRPVMVSGVTTNVIGETHALTYGAHAKGGWGIDLNETWGSSLNLNAAYIHQSQDEYTDSSGIRFGDLDTDTIRFGPSVDLIGTFQNGGTRIRPRASLGYLQQWTDGDKLVDITFSNGLTQSAAIEDRDEGFTTFGAGLDALFENGVTAFVGYDGEYGDEETRNRITAGLRFGL